jgi:tocopherol cyclase
MTLTKLPWVSFLFIACSAFVSRTKTIDPYKERRRSSIRAKLPFQVEAINVNSDDTADGQTSDKGLMINGGEICEPRNEKAFDQQTPHSGRHFLPSHPAYRLSPSWRNRLSLQKRRKRFTEGWYYRLTLPEDDVSFAFILSIEDPGHKPPSELRLACIQVVGPNDEYLVQGDRDDSLFWAWNKQQGLGCTFSYKSGVDTEEMKVKTALPQSEWYEKVDSGFQIMPTSLLGRVRGRDGTKGDILDKKGEPFSCDFDFSVDPICGWGGKTSSEQKSTAGWLASFPIFEPHWQITLADARANGSVTWKEKTYTFKEAPFYAEKNWGAALPRKWYWTQCNSFAGFAQLSVVAGGGIRKIPFGKEETLGMVSCHFNGTLYEAVPWLGGMSWEVATWGSWVLRGNSTWGDRPFEVEVVYKCDPATSPGLVFRAPTPDEGLVRFCRDTFEADCTLSLWILEWDDQLKRHVRKAGPPLIDRAKSTQGGAEVGGGPWWDDWKGEARLKRPIKALLRVPYRVQQSRQRLRKLLFG